MYHQSSQKKFWTFANEQDIQEIRVNQNKNFIDQNNGTGLQQQQIQSYFLTSEEEYMMFKYYEVKLRDFCMKFQPPMPKYTIGSALHYFKRFYLKNSVMNYHPNDIIATCAYLSCKVEEFNVSITQFVANIKGDRDKATEHILSNELLLMHELNYNLTIHNPFRAIEGFLIDIKTRCQMQNPERLRPYIDEFLDKAFSTDAVLIYAPSQIALAAVLHAASKEQENLDSYVTKSLFEDAENKLIPLIDAVRKIRSMVKNKGDIPDKSAIDVIERKIKLCRNQANNPESDIYKMNQRRLLYEDDEDIMESFSPDQSLDVSMINT
ncbi:unnamed protein product [Diamesa hyperborea]